MRLSVSLVLCVVAFPGSVTAQHPDGPAPVRASSVASAAFFAVSVADLEASRAWYQRVMGLDLVREVTSRDRRSRAMVLRKGNLVAELIEYDGSMPRAARREAEGHPLSVQGLFKTGIFVANAAELHQDLQHLGVQVDAAVMFDDGLQLHTFVFRDPDDNRIQVFAQCTDCPGTRLP